MFHSYIVRQGKTAHLIRLSGTWPAFETVKNTPARFFGRVYLEDINFDTDFSQITL